MSNPWEDAGFIRLGDVGVQDPWESAGFIKIADAPDQNIDANWQRIYEPPPDGTGFGDLKQREYETATAPPPDGTGFGDLKQWERSLPTEPIDLTPEQNKAAHDWNVNKAIAEDLSWIPGSQTRALVAGGIQGLGNIASAAIRPFDSEFADILNDRSDGMMQARQLTDTNLGAWFPKVSDYVQGASSSVSQMAGAVALTGGTGGLGTIIASGALIRANQAISEADRAGITGWDKISYVAGQGLIEGAVTAVFAKIPGFGGVESQAVAKSVIQQGWKGLAKAGIGEVSEEEIISFADQWVKKFAKVDPDPWTYEQIAGLALDTFLQTAMTLGMVEGGKAAVEKFTAATEPGLPPAPPIRPTGLEVPDAPDFSLNPTQQALEQFAVQLQQADPAKFAELTKNDTISRSTLESLGFEGRTSTEARRYLADYAKSLVFPSDQAEQSEVTQGSQSQPLAQDDKPEIGNSSASAPLYSEFGGPEAPAGPTYSPFVTQPADMPNVGDAFRVEPPTETPAAPVPTAPQTSEMSATATKTPRDRRTPADKPRGYKKHAEDVAKEFGLDQPALEDRMADIYQQEKAADDPLREFRKSVNKRWPWLANYIQNSGGDLASIKGMDDEVQAFLNDEWGGAAPVNDMGELAEFVRSGTPESPTPWSEDVARKAAESLLADQVGPMDITGTKKERTAELRRKLGVGPRGEFERETREEWQSKAASRLSNDSEYASKLADEIIEKPRVLDQVEVAAMNWHIRDLANRRKAGENVTNDLLTAIMASEKEKTVWGRSGVSSQAELAEDFSLVGIVRQHVRSVNDTPSDEKMDRYTELADQGEELQDELFERIDKQAKDEVDRMIAEHSAAKKKRKPEKKGVKKEPLRKAAADAVSEFKKEWSTLFQTGIVYDPKQEAEKWAKITKAAGKVVKAYVDLGVDSFAQLIARVKNDIGEISTEQRDAFRDAWKESQTEAEKPDLDKAGIGRLARELTRWNVESGITDREAVIDSVHEELTGMGLELSRSDAMAAMSGYGQFRELSKDEASVKIRGINGEIQQILKLEDMHAGKPPKKTGVERRDPTEDERRLIKLVNEAKKLGGYNITDPTKQLKSALTSAKTAASNRLRDLDAEIAELEKSVEAKTPVTKPLQRVKLTPDAELTALRDALAEKRKHRDEVRAAYDAIFPPTVSQKRRTAEQQEKAARKSIERIEGQLKDLKAGKSVGGGKKANLVSTKLQGELNQWREKLKAAKQAAKDAELNQFEGEGGLLQRLTGRRKPTIAQRLKSAEQLMSRMVDNLGADLKAGRLDSGPKGETLSSPALDAMQKRYDALKDAREEARKASPEYQAQAAMKHLEKYKKGLDRQLKFWEKRRDDAVLGKLPVKRKPTHADKEILELKYQIDEVRRHARAEIEEAERAARGPMGKALGFGGDFLDIFRPLLTAFEKSDVLMQGGAYTLGFPTKAFPSIVKSLHAAISRRADFAIHENLKSLPNHAEHVRGEVEVTAGDGPLSSREEFLRSRIVSWLAKQRHPLMLPLRIPAEGILASERSFRTFLNLMRADLFDYMQGSVEASRPGTWSEDDAKIIGSAANVISGRGKMPVSLSGGGILPRVFFAPRWVWSRGQMLVGQPLWKGDKATRLAIGKVYVRAALGMAVFNLLRTWYYSMLNDDDEFDPEWELDPRSSDFGKIKLGETRVGTGGGFGPLIVLAARLITGETKTSSGEIVPIRGENVRYGADDSRKIIHRFLDSKLAPLPSGVLDYLVGENVVGEKVTPAKVVTDRLTPMTWRDIWEAEKELNVPQGTVAAIEAFFGAGLMTYGKRSKFRAASETERAELFAKDIKGMDWDDPEKPAYAEMLSEGQLSEYEKRRDQKRGLVVYNSVYDGDSEDEKEVRDKNIEHFKKMKDEGMTVEDAKRLLQDYYKSRLWNTKTDKYRARQRAVTRIYAQGE